MLFRYFVDSQAGVVCVERLLFHRGGANNALPTAISHVVVYRDTYIVYRSGPTR